MAKETCSNCYLKLPGKVSFCPQCSRPTPHATEAERLEWDLGQWRQHVEHAVSSGTPPVATTSYRTVAVADAPTRIPSVPESTVEATRAPRAARPPRAPRPAREKTSRLRPWFGALRRSARQQDRVIVLDADHAFVYTACTTCERADWILRYSRNEDATYNYWCVRCSRSFKTDARLRHAVKPFIAAACVILPLVLLVRL